jgi:uncharacterized small protein (DUF1192 family)
MFEDLPRPKKNDAFPRNLVDMSIQELQDYIQDMKVEITRVEADITKKKASIEAAASIFKS